MHLDINQAATLLGGDVIGRNRVLCPGPGHSPRDRSLSVTFHEEGFGTNSFSGDDFRDCRDHVKALLGWTNVPAYVPPVMTPVASGSDKARIGAAMRIWESSGPIAGTVAETYLASRGLAYGGPALRFRAVGRILVAKMTDPLSGEPCGVHRTFLDPAGKKINRLMYGRAGVVRLFAAGTELAIAEGIETALATDHPSVWSCLTAGGIERFPVLPDIESLTIYADNDANGTGQRAAVACAERWHEAGRVVVIRMPADVGADYADREAA